MHPALLRLLLAPERAGSLVLHPAPAITPAQATPPAAPRRGESRTRRAQLFFPGPAPAPTPTLRAIGRHPSSLPPGTLMTGSAGSRVPASAGDHPLALSSQALGKRGN